MLKSTTILLAAFCAFATATTSSYAAFFHKGIWQETKTKDCSNARNCPIFFGSFESSRRITSVSCSVRVRGTGYPDLLQQAELLQRGKPERLFLGHIAQQRYTETEIVYQLLVTQPNFVIAFDVEPGIQLTFSSAPTDATASCSITADSLT